LVDELTAVAKDHAQVERYIFLGPVAISMKTDDQLSPGMVLVSGEVLKQDDPSKAFLVLPDGSKRELGSRSLTIGRLPDCAIVLADPNVSRYHAEVRPAANEAAGSLIDHVQSNGADTYEISDMGSTNGTRVNGLPIAGAHLLNNGDQITVGATMLRFERG
jgi:pSer/pThr/pTyr-binding forkhead associated (FHA) protein